MVRQMRRTKAKTRETTPVGITKKEIATEARAMMRKLKEFLSSISRLFLKETISGRRKENKNEKAPMRPVVVIRVKIELLDSEKRRFQRYLSRLRKTGRRRVKALRKVSGPVPRRAVCQIFMVSTAIDQPARRGRREMTGMPFWGRIRLMLIMVPMIIRRIEPNKTDLRVQFLIPVVKKVVAMRTGMVKEMAGSIPPVGLKKRSVMNSVEVNLLIRPK